MSTTEKPTLEQVAWVFKKLVEHAKEGGSFRYLIYERLGFQGNKRAYSILYHAGGMFLSNELHSAYHGRDDLRTLPPGESDEEVP